MAKNSGDETGFAGGRVREKRLLAGIKQAELASKAGISPSYLNLIEHNRRRIGGRLLIALAGGLGVDPHFLSHGAEADLIENLHDASQDKSAAKTLGDEIGLIEEFAERFPGWAQLIAAQRGRISQLESIIDGLNDRLTHDPVLSETMLDVLSTVSAIRSTASILVATPDIDAEWRQRFHANIDTESRRLAETSAAMAEHFEHLTHSSATYATPLEATQALFAAQGHHFAQIEKEGEGAIEGILDNAALVSKESRRMAHDALQAYARRAVQFPAEAVFAKLTDLGFSRLGEIASEFNAPLDDLLVRLAELPHNPEFPDMGCVQSDGAGALMIRNQVASFTIPRFGAACNLWPVFTAMTSPNQPIRRVVKSSENVKVSTYSIATMIRPPSFDAPPLYRSTMLIVEDAPDEAALEIGAACRVCPRQDCAARREPSILDSFTAN
jgi:predicted transcriptional regulator/transcriptional regulator with XRE-family HTH domain